MRSTMWGCLVKCLDAMKKIGGQLDKWVKDWPGQVHLCFVFSHFREYLVSNPC